jgi:sec-independent protein translocase protein TatB
LFDVGFTELVMIALVALLVVGPERLPELVRNTGRWIGRFQRIAREMRAELDRDIGREEFTRLQQDLRNTTSERINVDVTPAPAVITKPTEPGGPV